MSLLYGKLQIARSITNNPRMIKISKHLRTNNFNVNYIWLIICGVEIFQIVVKWLPGLYFEPYRAINPDEILLLQKRGRETNSIAND